MILLIIKFVESAVFFPCVIFNVFHTSVGVLVQRPAPLPTIPFYDIQICFPHKFAD